MYVCMYVCVHVCMYCMYICINTCIYAMRHYIIYVCMYACMHACMYVCMCVCIYIYIYIHTHTHNMMLSSKAYPTATVWLCKPQKQNSLCNNICPRQGLCFSNCLCVLPCSHTMNKNTLQVLCCFYEQMSTTRPVLFLETNAHGKTYAYFTNKFPLQGLRSVFL